MVKVGHTVTFCGMPSFCIAVGFTNANVMGCKYVGRGGMEVRFSAVQHLIWLVDNFCVKAKKNMNLSL